ncbi:MAG TPA: sigma-54 dependent transcriptional regulator [Chitinophagaceae bacterium]|nr:sigma-54 dependent transcriptional regulator [Chitinophagaceae bacterium]
MENGKVLIIDDENQLRGLMTRIINLEGYQVLQAADLAMAEKMLKEEQPDVMLCDVKLPDGSGVEFVRKIKPQYPCTEVILLTAFGNVHAGVQAMKNGAFDYLVKGDDNDKVIPLLAKAMESVRLQKRVRRLEEQVVKKYDFQNVIGQSQVLHEAITLAKKVAPTNTTVLLLGETGTGKEVFAQAIHYASKRSGHAFLPLNCSAFSKDLLESELFGHRAGAFTGATKDKKGLIEEANQGTLFLDEIGEMDMDLQAKVLRVLENNEFIKVGDVKPIKVNVRIIAATNKDLKQLAQENKFREDLYYRLAVFAIHLPPLRERKEDIELLANYFLKIAAGKINPKVTALSPSFLDRLHQHDWKGNIRELKNIIERAVILAEGTSLTPDQLPFDLPEQSAEKVTSLKLSDIEKSHIRKVMQYTNQNKTRAAELLGIGLTTLYRKLEEYNLHTN